MVEELQQLNEYYNPSYHHRGVRVESWNVK